MSGYETIKPKVVVDEKLNSKISDFSFDYDAFYDMARDSGLSREQIGSFSLVYTSDKKSKTRYGDYRYRHKTATIYAQTHFDDVVESWRNVQDTNLDFLSQQVSDNLNRTTIHETGHYVDYEIGDAKKRLVGAVLLNSGLASVCIAGAGIAYPGGLLVQGASLLGMGANMLRHRQYESHPNEVFAFDYEYNNAPLYQITSLTLSKDAVH